MTEIERAREEAIKKRDIIQAYLDGKPMQSRLKGMSEWIDVSPEAYVSFDFAKVEYRVKPEPTYRPYKDAQEFTKAVIAKGFVIKNPHTGLHSIIGAFSDAFIGTPDESYYSYATLLKDFHWASDDSPCGILEE